MKTGIFITGLLSIVSFFISLDSKAKISGIVTEEAGEPLIAATVSLYKEGVFESWTNTDVDGGYAFENLEEGHYAIEAAYLGYENKRVEDIKVGSGEVRQLDLTLINSGTLLDEIVIMEYKPPQTTICETTSGADLKSKQSIRSGRPCKGGFESISKLPQKNISAIAATSAGVSINSDGKISIRGSRNASSDNFDGIRVNAERAANMIPQAKIDASYAVVSKTEASVNTEAKEAPETSSDFDKLDLSEAGQLTAGEWNDLDNWSKWNELVANGPYRDMAEYWDMDLYQRHPVFIKNLGNLPLSNVKVELVSDAGEVLWTALTDHGGQAEIWLRKDEVFDAENLKISYKGKRIRKTLSSNHGEQGTQLTLTPDCSASSQIDVMFVVDATSSMDDEMDFLKVELSSVIDRIETKFASEDDFELRLGTVFYRDVLDDFVTKVTPLSKDIEKTLSFIAKEGTAGGGYDIPEALDAGLAVALEQDWNPEAINRLCFLILDAPPYHDTEVLNRIYGQIRTAAAKGIKLIPISASGINRHTEYLLKIMAMATNGTYVFLTDDSGIGGSHLEHVMPDYEVELLNDLLVRLIVNHTSSACQVGLSDPAIVTETVELMVYPNPTSNHVTLDYKGTIDKVIIRTSGGRQVLKIEKLVSGQKIDLSQFLAGIYQLSAYNSDAMVVTESIIKI